MDIERDVIDADLTVLHCDGRLNMVAAPALRASIEQSVNDGHARVVVDLAKISFIDSSGLGSLIAGLKKARQAGGNLRIAAATEQVLTVLRLTNLDRVLRPHLSVEEASRGW
ncbi:MAG TPA: STAS domain-containing protein [Propionibacteriaceae bacterium]